MNVREKLAALISESRTREDEHGWRISTSSEIANYLIENDVTIQKHARWHTLRDLKTKRTVMCTGCGEEFTYKKNTELYIDTAPFCPSCGAKMDLVGEKMKEYKSVIVDVVDTE